MFNARYAASLRQGFTMICVGVVMGCAISNTTSSTTGAVSVDNKVNVVAGAQPGAIPTTVPQAPEAPVIKSLEYIPTSTITADSTVTFSLVATEPAGKPLHYVWSASNGQIQSADQSTVSWKPPTKPSGGLEAGTTLISVKVSSATASSTGFVQLELKADPTAAPSSPAPGASSGSPLQTLSAIISRITAGVGLSQSGRLTPSPQPS
jgi:hypothetical protein